MKEQEKYRVARSTKAMAPALEAIQRACFPTLAREILITSEKFISQIEIFPEGQMAVILPDGTPVASATSMRCSVDFDDIQHRYMEVVDDNWLTTHEPEGEWLYGADMGVHPDHRRQGLSRLLYDGRKDLIRRLNLRGHVIGGMLNGYGARKDKMSVEEYVNQVTAGALFDPTVSVQIRNGFRIAGIIHDYLDDPTCDNKAAFMIWDNPDYKA